MLKRIFGFALAMLLTFAPAKVFAQSSPGLITGQVPTAVQWNSYFAAKQDVLGFVPLNTAGGIMTGRLITATPTTSGSGFRLPHGAAPTTPVNGDLWTTTAGMFIRINGTTVPASLPVSTANAALLSDSTGLPTWATGGIIYAAMQTGANAGAKIQACIDALPAGGICNALGLTGAQIATATITIDEPVVLQLGSINLSGNSLGTNPVIDLRKGGAVLMGLDMGNPHGDTDQSSTVVTAGAGTTGSVIMHRVGAGSGGGQVTNIKIDAAGIAATCYESAPGSGGAVGMPGAHVKNLDGVLCIRATVSGFKMTPTADVAENYWWNNLRTAGDATYGVPIAIDLSAPKIQGVRITNSMLQAITKVAVLGPDTTVLADRCTNVVFDNVITSVNNASGGPVFDVRNCETPIITNSWIEGVAGMTTPLVRFGSATATTLTPIMTNNYCYGNSAIANCVEWRNTLSPYYSGVTSSLTGDAILVTDTDTLGTAVNTTISTTTGVLHYYNSTTMGFGGGSLILGQNTTTAGSIRMYGSATGNALLAMQAAAGTPTLTLPTETGTLPSTAAAPLAINATTGQITCSTCFAGTAQALTRTDDTNVTLTLGGTPATALLQAVSLTLGWSGQLLLTRGGTNASLTAVNGGMVYSTASGMAISSAGTSGQVWQSNGAAAPTAVSTLSNTVQDNITRTGTLVSGATGAGFTVAIGTSTVTGVLAMANGGTAKALTAVAGGTVYTDGDSMEVLAAGLTGQLYRSNGTSAPSWTTATFPQTATSTGTILRADGTNWAASTASYPGTTNSGGILFSSAANTITDSAFFTWSASSGILNINGAGSGSTNSNFTFGNVAGGNYGQLYYDGLSSDGVYLWNRRASASSHLNLGTQSTSRWQITGTGDFLAVADNAYDIGASAATRPRSIFVGTNISAGSAGTLGFASRSILSAASDGVLMLSNAAASDFSRLQFGGTTSSFPALERSGIILKAVLGDSSAGAAFQIGDAALTLTSGALGLDKITASASAPGAGGGKLELVCGTNAGTAKLIIAAGTSGTAVTIVDNIGAGVAGC